VKGDEVWKVYLCVVNEIAPRLHYLQHTLWDQYGHYISLFVEVKELARIKTLTERMVLTNSFTS
jgi:hypothetical protein